MNEQNPELTPIEPAAIPYKDRSTGLNIFGVLTILLGCLAGLLVLLMLVQTMAIKTANAPTVNFTSLLPALSIYALLAVALIWLGIGSMQGRRWARALLLIFSWGWLIVGVIMMFFMGIFVPKILAGSSGASGTNQIMPAAAIVGVMVVMFIVLGIFFVILPAVWVFFYGSSHVKATCETRDPVTRWTDACPLPVLGFCLWLLMAVPTLLLMPLITHGVMPFFGIFISGLPGSLLCVATAVLWAYAAWLLYKLDVRGWWLILIALVVYMGSTLMTFGCHDIIEMYRLMGYPQAQIDQIQKIGLFTGNDMSWFMVVCWLPFLGYLLFIKKYLRSKS